MTTAETQPPIYIVSGGAGALGKHVARIALSQFPSVNARVSVIPQVRDHEQLSAALRQISAQRGLIIHTMVDPTLRASLTEAAAAEGIPAIDTISEPLARIGELVAATPLGQPGLYQRQHEVYLERIQAIEYTVDHDDGRNPHELALADVVLAGVSRVGKTPLSIYLSVLGWKVANVPLVPQVPPPDELFAIDRRRVVGLTIDCDVLSYHRHWRQRHLGGAAGQSYTDAELLADELHYARRIFGRGGFAVVNVTNKQIEETADQVIGIISRSFEHRVKP